MIFKIITTPHNGYLTVGWLIETDDPDELELFALDNEDRMWHRKGKVTKTWARYTLGLSLEVNDYDGRSHF